MHRLTTVALLAAILSFSCTAGAGEQPVESRITSLGLFKNGLAVVKRSITVPEPGTYRIEDAPEPVHGTFWVESDAKVTTRVTTRMVEVPSQPPSKLDFQQELVGRDVVIHFSQTGIPPATGTVVAVEPRQGEQAWSRRYERPQYGYYSYYYGSRRPTPAQGSLLILQTDGGRAYVDASMIAYLEARGATGAVERRRPVLLFSVGEVKGKRATIEISYLAKGMAWAPSYRVDLTDPRVLTIRQKAVIKNELGAIDSATIRLISGYPSIRFAHVSSPLSLRTTWADFFSQLNQRFRAGHAAMSNVISQQRIDYNAPSPTQGIDLSAVPAGEGVDLHYQEIGRHTLAEGDSLALDVASAKAPYERIVEWTVPDTRTPHGRHIAEHERNQDPEKYKDAVWDAVRFRNPLAFPMTTGPAMIVSGGRFNGQRTSFWTNTGEQTTLHVTKALSIRTRSFEAEEPKDREEFWIGGLRYFRTTVRGELSANNHRNETVTLVIRRRFSGELLEADQSPQCTLLEEGVYCANRRNQLTWSLALEPGEEVRLGYRYRVFVNR